MIIADARYVPTPNTSNFAWSNLRRFQNIDVAASAIIRLHQLGARNHANAKRQAEEVRHCLIQAREYFDAAAQVSLSTKPTLLYYGLMSLALAEILLKQDANSRLQQLRQRNRHHGLQFHSRIPHRGQPQISNAASALVATPIEKPDGSRFGTFDVWHQSARQVPLTSHGTFRSQQGESYGISIVTTPSDNQLSKLPLNGMTLLEALVSLPSMANYLDARGIASGIIRAAMYAEHDLVAGSQTVRMNIHPTAPAVLNQFQQNWNFQGLRHQFNGVHQGGMLQWVWPYQPSQHTDTFPPVAMANRTDWFFWPTQKVLNEFGFFYVALFILGNYARYFPDQWIRDVEMSSPLALVSEEFLNHAEQRVPLLTLSEMDRYYYVAVN